MPRTPRHEERIWFSVPREVYRLLEVRAEELSKVMHREVPVSEVARRIVHHYFRAKADPKSVLSVINVRGQPVALNAVSLPKRLAAKELLRELGPESLESIAMGAVRRSGDRVESEGELDETNDGEGDPQGS